MAVGVVSIVAPISATGAALPVAFGVLRGERATLAQAVGIGLAPIGIVLASRSANSTHDALGRAVARGVGLAILAALGFGVFFIVLHEASTTDVLWAGAVQCLAGVCFVGLLVVGLRRSVAIGLRRAPRIAVVGVLDTTATVLYAAASTMGLVSVAAVLASLYPVVTVTLARLILHEHLTLLQAAGVICALAGVALIAMA
jgi:drug/metabolite transporter (DMT)-like permease